MKGDSRPFAHLAQRRHSPFPGIRRRARRGSACAAFAVVSLFGRGAWSQEAETIENESYYYTEYQQTWYGWQTLAVDVPLLSTYFVAEVADEGGVALAALGGFVVGAPAVHLGHRRVKPAVVSGFAHLLLPLAGSLARPLVTEIMPEASLELRTAIPVTVGGLAASSLDVFYLAYEEEGKRIDLSAGNNGGWWVPQVGWTGRGGWIGAIGGF